MLARSRARLLLVLLTAALSLVIGHAALGAEPLDPKAVPEPLRPWTSWALDGHEEAACPKLLDRPDPPRVCLWPARLELTLDERGGRFSQSWHADAPGWAALPGDAKRWPTSVAIDGKRAVLVPRDGGPGTRLTPGDHTITGSFAWDSLPEALRVPPETGLLALTLRGARVAAPNRDAQGTVWLQKAATNDEGSGLELVVHRKIADGVPVLLTTHIDLHVAGKSREELLGKALLPGFTPMTLDGGLPARLEPDGRLRVQVRPGVFSLELTARSDGPVAAITRTPPEGTWREGEEVWTFEAKNDVRVVTIEGPPSIDPQQTTLPEGWKKLPAYPMRVGDTLKLVEKRRGDADPPPNQLSLSRVLWLDFDGQGYTARDTITGSLTRDTRLSMAAPTVLGRVAIGGKDQLITTLAGDAKAIAGVEVRQGALDVSADSRIPGDPSDLPAVGWAHDFHQVRGTLHLPPGWRLLHASGVDEVPGTWLRHWSLLELFLAVLVSIAMARLYGARWGIVAVALFALTFPEEDAPKWTWIVLLVAEALYRALPAGKVRALAAGARTALSILVALIAIPFLVQHLREGLHPALARSAEIGGTGEGAADVGPKSAAIASPMELAPSPASAPAGAGEPPPSAPAPQVKSAPSLGRGGGHGTSALSSLTRDEVNAQVYDPTAIVQTGPGLPRWSWTTLSLTWSGPVTEGQRLHLYLLSPAVNLALAFIRAALLLLVLARVVPWSGRLLPRGWGAPAAATLLAAALLLAPKAARADVPSNEVLDELRARLLRDPECLPSCASSGRMMIEARGDVLRARLEVDAAASTAVPLPGRTPQWSPSQVTLDGRPAKGLARLSDGTLWIELGAGAHQIAVEGPMPEGPSMQLALPLKPHRVEAQASGWDVAGVHEDGLADDDLELTRIDKTAPAASLQPGALPPFAAIERTLRVGLDWQVETRVSRLTPVGSAMVLEVPLLPGESVTTADIRVAGGKVQVNLGPQASEVVWRSVLEQRSPLKLVAPKTIAGFETWRVDVGPVWHATFGGIPFVHTEPVNGLRVPEWRPWPGEEATVVLVRPAGVPGQALTIDESAAEITPGLRATDVSLSLSIRSSRGGEHTVALPPDAQLESLSINGAPQPIRQDGRRVTFPIVPGAQRVALTWRETPEIALSFSAPAIDLGAPSVNASTTIRVPGGRWLLFVGGPRLGPAILFWSLLIVLVIVAVALGKNRWTPLRGWHWLLLGLGLAQVHVVAGAVVVGWFVAVGWRGTRGFDRLGAAAFDAMQILLALWTVVALVLLAVAIHQGLLGAPSMQVEGNGSTPDTLRWFVDRSESQLPTPWMISVPLLVYRVAMLAWALWLAMALLRWVRWAWGAYTSGGVWRQAPRRAPPPLAPPPFAPPAPMPVGADPPVPPHEP